MKTLTTQSERAAMVPQQVAMLLNLLGDAKVAGGAVRDALLDVEPKDWDVATSLLPARVTELAKQAGFTVLPTGLQHGTVTVLVGKLHVEVTTLRVDVETDGRHAEVEFTTDWVVDASRRDLTMNAMFMDANGNVMDFFGGMDDLVVGTVRFVGNASERVQEDYLRILRYFRFAGRMGVTHFDHDAVSAVKRNMNGLHNISGERVWMEMSKILSGPMVENILGEMEFCEVFTVLGFPVVQVANAVLANQMHAKPETVLGALLDTPEAVDKAVADWKLSKAEREMARFVASHTHDRVRVQNWSLLDWQKMVVTEGKERVLELLCLTDRADWKDMLVNWVAPVFPLTGAHLIAVGVTPGPEMGRKLKAAKQAWLDADFQLDLRKLSQLVAA